MSNIEDSIESLELKIGKILDKLSQVEQANLELVEALNTSKNKIETQAQELKTWEENYESLKIANSILGSDTDKRETKLKINTLIREIDLCIAQLSE